jgi:hypothetical protein
MIVIIMTWATKGMPGNSPSNEHSAPLQYTLGPMLCHEIDFLTSMRELRAANANASTYASAKLCVAW